MLKIKRYSLDSNSIWDDFVSDIAHYPFILERRFMNYHINRFSDHSLLIYSDTGRLLGLFPAHIKENSVYSHNGLTYGGLIHAPNLGYEAYSEIMEAICSYYSALGCTELFLKGIPQIYYSYPADHLSYFAFKKNAVLCACGLSSAVYLPSPLPFSKLRKRKVNKSRKACLTYCEGTYFDLERFWQLLGEVLRSQHGVDPVHSFEEISQLQLKYPQNIQLYIVEKDGELLAGTLLFIHSQVVHAQYIAANTTGRNLCALDGLFQHLIDKYRSLGYAYFDFGISTESAGRELNHGLLFQKEGFGGRSVTYKTYKIPL